MDRCCFSRGTLMVLVMSGLLYVGHWFVYDVIELSFSGLFKTVLEGLHSGLLMLLPVIGWVAESWLGRYRAVIIGLVMSAIPLLLILLAFITLQSDWSPFPAFVLVILALLFGTFGIGSWYTNMLPFTLDQMIGASAEELSAVAQWYCWGFNIGPLIKNTLLYIPLPSQLQVLNILPIVLLSLGSLAFSTVLAMDYLCHKWLDTHKKTGNPIKLIFRVLNYARKNTYPRLRSAFTYIDEEQPSRLDFGKHKFGGPFTEEEVEDVKTVIRLTPLLASVCGPLYICIHTGNYDQFSVHAIPTSRMTFQLVNNMTPTIFYLVSFVLIPVHRFFVHPLIGKHIPSMLKVMGTGLFLCFTSTVVSLAVNSIGHFYSNMSQCIFDDNIATGTIPIPVYWVLIIDIVNGVGILLALCSLFEFAMAQTPNRMRGIMMGIIIAMFIIGDLAAYLLATAFRKFPKSTPNCVFYYYLILALLMLSILVVYVILAKHYKLRERDRHINIHAIVEEHYERYFDQEEEYMREKAIAHHNQ